MYGPPSIVSVVIRPTFYQYGDDVELACAVESNPDYDQLGWNMLVNTHQFKGKKHKALIFKSLFKAFQLIATKIAS